MDISFEFKTDGRELTGTTIGYNRKENPIKDGEINGNSFSFVVESRFQGTKSTANYTGLFLGDTIKFTLTVNIGSSGATSPPVTFNAKRIE